MVRFVGDNGVRVFHDVANEPLSYVSACVYCTCMYSRGVVFCDVVVCKMCVCAVCVCVCVLWCSLLL